MGDIIYLSLRGYQNADSAIQFVYEAESVIQHTENARILLDCSDFKGMSESAKGIFAVLMIQNKPYVLREAIICLSEETRQLFKELVQMAERYDARIFDDKKTAVAWLSQDNQ